MTELTPELRHFGVGLTYLIPSLWGKPRVAALLQSFLRQVQLLEDDAWEVMGAFDVRTADATRLAILGKIVVQPNFGWDLETYRKVIMAKIAANRSRGLEDDIIRVLQIALPTTIPVVMWSLAPATLVVMPQDSVSPEAMEALLFLLPKTRAAGVQMHVLFSPDSASPIPYDYSDTGLFFSDVVDPITTPGAPFMDERIL